MSGTSLDGVDGVLADFDTPAAVPVRVIAHAHRAFAGDLKLELLALNSPGPDELHRAALAANALTLDCAELVQALLDSTAIDASQVRAIGAHGQTVRHRPREFDGIGYTLQLNAPALLAERTSIDVIADFRSRDVAAGGLGAPLVPAFHRAAFGHVAAGVAVLNIGGIANLTFLDADGSTSGFDCGPGNVLMDLWCQSHTGEAFDAGGRWAATGRVSDELLASMLGDGYFERAPPKATGRDLFNRRWLDSYLCAGDRQDLPAGLRGDLRQDDAAPATPAWRAEDVQATLAELTAAACARDLLRHGADVHELLVCGGGALNTHLMQRMSARLPGLRIATTESRGLPVDQVEACAFAWLARAFVERECGNLSRVTGARGPRVLGCLYPGYPG